MLIVRLRSMGADREIATALVERAVATVEAAPPAVTFHGGRGPHTGYCRAPRARAVALSSERTVGAWEDEKGPWPEHGMIRLGDPTSLGTVAHELGHHYVNVFDPISTPPHGKVWVARFDQAAAQIATLVEASD